MRLRKGDFAKLPESMQRAIARQLADSAPHVEPNPCNGDLAEKATPRYDTPCRINVHSVRKRLADPDGISAKAAIDGLVRAAILADDSAKQITQISYSQEKGEPEETIITITPEAQQ